MRRKPIRLPLNLIRQVSGLGSNVVTPADVANADDRDAFISLLRVEADDLRAALAPLITGDCTIVDRVREQLPGVPGDPTFDWWVDDRTSPTM